MKFLEGGITEVQGISAMGKHIGLKKKKKDFGIIFCEKPVVAAGIYTSSSVKAAPVLLSKKHLANGTAQAIVVNSAIANACTGRKGMKNAEETTKLAAKELGVKKEDIIVASTGRIGDFLPMDKIKKGINGAGPALGCSKKAASDFASSILTTDRIKKEVAIRTGGITIAGVAKGSGMINPNMATTLIFLATDAALSSSEAKAALKKAADKSFNMLCVDNDMSTNDMAVLLANGSSRKKPGMEKFQQGLELVCRSLVKKLAEDGEGATKYMEINVKGAKNEFTARKIAKAVAQSSLVKTAVFGKDPNWGRIMAAIGASSLPVNENKVRIMVDGIKIVENGVGKVLGENELKRIMSEKEVSIKINLNNGNAEATSWGCDLTYGYVKINAKYHT